MNTRKTILFVNPPLNANQRYGILAQAGAIEPPLGLAYLAATTRKLNFGTAILDASALGINIEETIKIIVDKNPDFLAITASSMSISMAAKLATLVKKKIAGLKIFIGGPHFNSLPEQTLKENHCFDIGIIGEGERTIEELLNAIIQGNPLNSIEGIAFKNNEKIILTAKRKRIKNLDELPMPAFDLLPELKKYYRTTTQSIMYLPTVSLVTSRGCSGHCSFCDRMTFGNEVRMHSAEYVADLMQKLKNDFGINGVIFEDDNFMLSEERLVNLAKLIKKRKIKIHWSVLSRVDTITKEKLKIAKSCGCWQILYGIESGSQKILDFYKKGITIAQIKRAVKLTKESGLYVKGLFILGNPLESLETLRETRDLIMNLPMDDISLTSFTPYPGAEIWNRINEFGKFEKDWDKLTCFDSVFVPNGLLKEDVITMQNAILKKFYTSAHVLWSYFKRLRSFSQIKELYRSGRALLTYCQSTQSKKKLIINADDFGLCEGINNGVDNLLQSGSLTSVSIMPTGYAFTSAVKIAKNNASINLGIHLSLIETKPILPLDKIPSLINKNGVFKNKFYIFLTRYLLGKINKVQVTEELRAQIEKVKEEGIIITHLDSHQHVHMLPGIFLIVLKLAKEYKIPFIRLPCIPFNLNYFLNKATLKRKIFQSVLNFLCACYKPILKKEGLNFTKFSFGFLESGHLGKENLKAIMGQLKEGEYELICHPGLVDDELKRAIGHWEYNWQEELENLKIKNIKENLDLFGVKIIKNPMKISTKIYK